MTHQRTDLRTAVRDGLAGAGLGLNVRRVWSKDIDISRLPDAFVATPVANHTSLTGASESATDLVVVMRAAGATPDDTLDDLAVTVEGVVNTAVRSRSYVMGSRLTRSEIEFSGQADTPVAQIQMVFVVQTSHAKGDQSV